MSINSIIKHILVTQKMFAEHAEYSKKAGLYAFTLCNKSELHKFGKGGQILYVGKAEKSLATRDLNTHFKDGKTGNSTLRRSIGAILKIKFKSTSFTRNGSVAKAAVNHFKFDSGTESKLTSWMKLNLKIGFWEYDKIKENTGLYDLEEKIIIQLRPTLDLDKRTRKYNVLADELTELRQICKNEALQNAAQKIKVF